MTAPAAAAPSAPPVRVHGLDVALGGRLVLQQVDLEVAAGEFVALLGTNGSGKSTLVRSTIGLLPAAAGSIELFGTPVGRFGDWQRIGYVPQRSTAASGVPATVREVVASGMLARHRYVGLPGRAARSAVDEALEIVGLADRRRDSVSELSGGQQQRVMIARALAGRCDLLVMDEPTAGVDRQSQVVLTDVLARLLGRGTTIWMVAHELGPLGDLVDRAVVLQDGQVVHDGPHGPELAEPHDHHHPYSPAPQRPRSVEHRGVWG